MAYILVFGDSTTYGAFDFDKGGWVNRLRHYCDSMMRKNPDEFFIVYNLGIDGHTTKDWLTHFDIDADSRVRIVRDYNKVLPEKDRDEIIFIIQTGGNDSIFIKSKNKNKVPKAEFEYNLRKLLTAAKKYADAVIFVGLHPVDDEKTNPFIWNKDIFYRIKDAQEYDKIAKKVCSAEKIFFIEILDKLISKKGIFFSDGLHLNSAGHKIIFETVRDFLIDKKLI